MQFDTLLKKSWQSYVKSFLNLLLFTLLGIVLSFTIILIPTVIGGFTRGFIKFIREGKDLEFGELLNFDKYLDLALLTIIGGLILMIGYMLLVLPGLILNVLWFYAAYFIVDKNLGFWDAMKASLTAVRKSGFFNNLVMILIMAVLTSVGSSVVFGAIFTTPFCLVLAAYVYLDISKAEESEPAA